MKTEKYDDNGNLINDGTYKYYYDCENRLIDVNQDGNSIATYAYDYLGRRVVKTIHDSQTTIHYTYDGDQVITETENDGATTLNRRFFYGPGIDEPICMIDIASGNKVYYYHFDGLGSVVALSNVNREIVEYYEYDVYGGTTIRDSNGLEISESSVGNPFMFTGRRFDVETGLYYYRARYYNPVIGRFVSVDALGIFLQTSPIQWESTKTKVTSAPLSDNLSAKFSQDSAFIKLLQRAAGTRLLQIVKTARKGGLNFYAYVGNDPVNWMDPSGNIPIPRGLGCIGCAVGITASCYVSCKSDPCGEGSAWDCTNACLADIINFRTGSKLIGAITIGCAVACLIGI